MSSEQFNSAKGSEEERTLVKASNVNKAFKQINAVQRQLVEFNKRKEMLEHLAAEQDIVKRDIKQYESEAMQKG